VWVRTHWFKSLNITSRYSRYSRCDTWRATGRLQPARPRSLAARAAALGGAPWLLSFSGMAGVLGWPPRAPLVAECDRGRVLASWAATCGGRRPRQRLIPFAAVRTMAPEDFVRALAEDLQARGRRSSGGAVPQCQLAPPCSRSGRARAAGVCLGALSPPLQPCASCTAPDEQSLAGRCRLHIARSSQTCKAIQPDLLEPVCRADEPVQPACVT